MKTLIIAAIAAANFGAAAQASTVNLVTNGSFEDTPDFSGSWRVFQGAELDGWEVQSGAGVEIQTNSVGSVLDTLWGTKYVELDSHNGNGGATTGPTNSAIGQDIFLSAGHYLLSFYYSPRVNSLGTDTNGIDYSIAGVSGSASGPNDDFRFGEWTLIEETVKIDVGDTYKLLFAATGGDETLGGLIDNVSLTAVPLPAGMLLLMTALGGLGIARRQKG
ncbi:VPLPA-CTERM sorting domain-containing protein [Tateyamaria sp. Alg231-49]|uniref:VPLPA-CTERM sorting domain-containing protein n=1 Tax=Tateyamaria sp. Alg231-49 TaxID=1922219 RepID=UPI00131F2B10|nr:VPLPA-CTERM sorting domain-containing protein [Tateyamaria sp. Alg231-49]